eukprot:TRINITY_DN4057_c0_g1_i3.p1 TRINITY_DN4057_c0_g1~~TRINITY_DN4057_c0_g1_i3.p1  ORF type:complete len:331 (+),score=80.54 TRINITY_DN4057_c0_g1_i3:61-993(+)
MCIRDRRNTHTNLQRFFIAFLRDEFYIIISCILFCAVFTWIEFQFLLRSMQMSGNDTVNQGPYSNQSWMIFSFLEQLFLIGLTFLLRNVEKQHNIMKELGLLTVAYFFVNYYAFLISIRDSDWVTCSSDLDFLRYSTLRFAIAVIATMVIPLRGASEGCLPLSPSFVLRKFRMFINEKDCLRSFIEFLQVKKPKSDNELLSFAMAMKILKDFDLMNDDDRIEELYNTYFSNQLNCPFPDEIRGEIENRRKKQGMITYADFEAAHSYSMRILEEIFEMEFKKTWCFFYLRDKYSDNQLFQQNLIYLNMIRA